MDARVVTIPPSGQRGIIQTIVISVISAVISNLIVQAILNRKHDNASK